VIRGLVYLTGFVTLLVIGMIAAVAFRVDRWAWREYAESGRQYVVNKLEEAQFEPTGGNAGEPPAAPRGGESAAPSMEALMVRHVVLRGDTLYRIAGHYYGDSGKWRSIAMANGIRAPSDLRVGKVLLVPVAGGPEAAPERAAPSRTSWPESRLALSPATVYGDDTEGNEP
jgi:LysM repeat protein